MTLPRLLAMLIATVVCLGGWWLLSGVEAPGAGAPRLLPDWPNQAKGITRIELRGAGDAVRVTLVAGEQGWTVAERQHWPAHDATVQRLLRELGEARRVEGKTQDPARYPRLAVEPVDAADAGGIELRLEGSGKSRRLIIGDPTATGEQRYVRLADEPQAWRVDRPFDVPGTAAGWVERALIDRPVARVAQVVVQPARGKRFELNRVEDRFGLDALPPAALADPDRGNATAAFLDALQLDDVAVDVGQPAEQTVRYVGVDGLDVVIEAWTQDTATWARCSVEFDEARAKAWVAPTGADAATGEPDTLATLNGQAESLRSRCAGHVFQLPEYKARNLMRSREQYLAD